MEQYFDFLGEMYRKDEERKKAAEYNSALKRRHAAGSIVRKIISVLFPGSRTGYFRTIDTM